MFDIEIEHETYVNCLNQCCQKDNNLKNHLLLPRVAGLFASASYFFYLDLRI